MNRDDLKKRLDKLEALPRASELPTAPAGMRLVGRALLVPAPMLPDAWERMARDQQAELAEREARFAGM